MCRAERRHGALLDHALDVVSLCSAENAFLYVSPSVEDVLGYAPEELVGTTASDLVHPDDAAGYGREVVEGFREVSGPFGPLEARYRHKDGSWRYLETTINVLLDDPEVEGVVCVSRDVTERRRLEEEVRDLSEGLEREVARRTGQHETALDGLAESEERFRATFDQAAVGMAHVGVDGGWLRVNQKLCDIVDYPREELLGLGFQDITHPEDLEKDLGYLRRLLAGEIGTYSTEKRYFRKDGSIVWIDLTVSLVRKDSGEPEYFISVIEDVSKRKLAEEALRMSETRFRTVIEQSPLSTQILSPEGRTLRVNRAWEELWGATLEDIEGYNMLEDRQLVEKGIMPHIRKGFAGESAAIPPIDYDPEQTIPGLSSHEDPKRWVRAFIYPVKDEAGNVREVVLVHEDVTERKRTEETLRESEGRYRAVVEQAGEGIFLFDPRTKRILEANPAFQKMFGYAPEEVERITLYDLVPHDAEGVDRNVALALERGYLLVGDRSYRRKDGSLVDVEVSGGTISYRGKEVICSVVRDVTERKRAEATLRGVREAERNRMARDLHDGALQDLTYALVEAQIIRALSDTPELDKRLADQIEALRRTERRLRGAVYDLRLGEEGGRPLAELLETLVDESRRMFSGCEVRLAVDGGLPDTPPGEGGVEVLRVLGEALSNARRHSGAALVAVTVWAEGADVVAEVSDDGRGFVPGEPGGVGLKSMRERTAALGGDLEVESEPGAGTRVRLRVPMRRLGVAEHD
ncbi:MAG: PAS domain S-box protein [Actinomycetota bacterium]|nr:PAS domain S-box protein [Actinomycetota bacterium]